MNLSKIKQKIVDWCLSKQTISIGDLHDKLNASYCQIYCDNELKFIEKSNPDSYYVKTPSGYSKIKHSLKTVPYEVWEIKTENKSIKCADNHILISESGDQLYAKDLIIGENIKTIDGYEQIVSKENLSFEENMFDLELEDDEHVFYTNDIVSHNTTTVSAYLLWYAMFNMDKTILIASNKDSNAIELIKRIKYQYENLPTWLKAGVLDDGYNMHEISFDNKSRIVSTATSSTAGRSFAISLLYLDEFAFVPPEIQDEFWTSIAPTLSEGGRCIITSTPNGDVNLFAELWRGAQVGLNGFDYMHVKWDDPPGRNKEFKNRMTGKLGVRKWLQEYETKFLSSDALLIDPLVLERITHEMKNIRPVHKIKDITFWEKILPRKNYLIGVDPATGTGDDFSVIHTYEFPSLVQVAEYRSNTMSTSQLYTVLKNLIKYIESKGSFVYFSVENNGVGEGLMALYESDETPPENAEMVDEDGKKRRGMTTTGQSKMKACVNFKEMFEKDNIKIRSQIFLSELKSYVRTRGAYEAQTGSTDDCIAATLIVTRIIEEIAVYEQTAFDKLYGTQADDWGKEGWGEEKYDEYDDPMPMSFG